MKNMHLKRTSVLQYLGSVMLCTFTALVLSFTVALCIHNEYLSIESKAYLMPMVQFFCVLIGGVFAGKTATNNAVVACAVSGVSNLLLCLCFALLFFDGLSGNVIVSLTMTIIATMCAIFVCSRKKKAAHGKRGRTRYR